MKIGVTGASGFIGRKLCKALNESDFEVHKFVRVKKENQEYTGQENGHLRHLFRHINHLKIIQTFL